MKNFKFVKFPIFQLALFDILVVLHLTDGILQNDWNNFNAPHQVQGRLI